MRGEREGKNSKDWTANNGGEGKGVSQHPSPPPPVGRTCIDRDVAGSWISGAPDTDIDSSDLQGPRGSEATAYCWVQYLQIKYKCTVKVCKEPTDTCKTSSTIFNVLGCPPRSRLDVAG